MVSTGRNNLFSADWVNWTVYWSIFLTSSSFKILASMFSGLSPNTAGVKPLSEATLDKNQPTGAWPLVDFARCIV